MAASAQEVLKAAWIGGRHGSMSALAQARAWALRAVWRDDKKPDYGMLVYICGKVKKVGGGSPTSSALKEFFEKVDADADWYPGKCTQKVFGPESVISKTNQAVVARCAMAMKARGEDPTYPRLVAANPTALLNPKTEEPVGKKRLYSILTERCYDDPDNQQDTWGNRPKYSKTALTDAQQELRLTWARDLQEEGRTEEWYFKNLVWTDICNTIIPRTEAQAQQLTMSRKAKKGWRSEATALESNNLQGKPEARKQKSWGTTRFYWAPVVARGKVHLEVLGESFPGETPEGAATLVAAVRTSLNIRFQATTPPRVVFTDRGQGFYSSRSGVITDEYKAALREHGLKAYYGDDASIQPGSLQEVLLHETVVAWVRSREKVTQPKYPWTETEAQYGSRLRGICQYINQNYDVDGLCRALLKRVQKVVDAGGGRINH